MAEMVKKATRESFGEAVTALAAENPNIVVLDADLAEATKTGIFKKKYPERFFDCGIAEHDRYCRRFSHLWENSLCRVLCHVCGGPRL